MASERDHASSRLNVVTQDHGGRTRKAIGRSLVLGIWFIGLAGCGAVGSAKTVDPAPSTVVSTPEGQLTVFKIAGPGGALGVDELDAPGFTTDPVTDYLEYGGPPDVPFFQVEQGRLVGIWVDSGEQVKYTFALQGPDDHNLDTYVEQAAESIRQRFPDYTADELSTENRDYFDSRSVALNGPKRQRIVIRARTDTRYPNAVFVELVVALDQPSTKVILSPEVQTIIGPLIEASGLTTNDVEASLMYVGWDLDGDPLQEGMMYRPLFAQLTIDAAPMTPSELEAKIGPIVEREWQQSDRKASIRPKPDEPDTAIISVEIGQLQF